MDSFLTCKFQGIGLRYVKRGTVLEVTPLEIKAIVDPVYNRLSFSLLDAHSDDSVHAFRRKASTCSEGFRPDGRSVATLGLCYFPILLFIVKSERSFLMDSPFKLIL